MGKIGAILCASVLFVSPALAADPAIIRADEAPEYEAPNPERFGSWTGAYVGVSGGYGWLRDVDRSFVPPLRSKGDDFVFGVYAGYLYQYGMFVGGVEAEYQRQKINFEGFPIDTEDAYMMKAKAGVAYDQWLATAHLGAVYATTSIGLDDWGIVAGAGVDYMVNDYLTVGANYSHQFYDTFDGTLIDAGIDTLTMRVGVKF